MPIRLSGLTSGLDTDAIVQELVSAYSMKTEKYEKAQTKLSWKQDAWKDLNTKIYGLYTNVSNMRYSSAYNLRKTTVSDNTKATVTASGDAVTGTQKLNILRNAQAAYLTGGKLKDGTKADTMMSALGYSGKSTTIEVQKADGTKAEVKITKTTKISDVVKQFNDAGISANFDEKNGRIFLSSKETGAENDFYLVGGDADGDKALEALGLNTALTKVDEDGNTVFTEAGQKHAEAYEFYKKALEAATAAGVDVDVKAYLEQRAAEYKVEYDKHKQAEEANLAVIPEQKELMPKVKELEHEVKKMQSMVDAKNAYDSLDGVLQDSGITVDDIRGLFAADSEKTEVTAEDLKGINASLTDDEAAALATSLNDAGVKDKVAKMNECEALNDGVVIADINVTAVTSALEEKKNELKPQADRLAELNKIIMDNTKIMNDCEKYFADNDDIGFLVEGKDNQTQIDVAVNELTARVQKAVDILADPKAQEGTAVKLAGTDAEITLNGEKYTSASNTFEVNGLTIQATGVTGEGDDNAITVTTSVDYQGIYDKVKDFLTEYNNVMNEMCKLYNAESAGEYEPLTDEEKEAMSEEQIEKWEGKIKNSLLRRDTTLNGVMNVMINSMSRTYDVNGKKMSLSNFGISTLGFLNAAENENYAYHINGDADDENTSGKKDELMKAIQEDPEQVTEFMKQLTENLYKEVDNKMKSTSMSSAYKVYNDKEMDSQMVDYAKLISRWEKKISEKEEYYYKKFSAMESALASLQNQTSSLSGLFGSGS